MLLLKLASRLSCSLVTVGSSLGQISPTQTHNTPKWLFWLALERVQLVVSLLLAGNVRALLPSGVLLF